jgi:hypothetical protein
MVKLYLKMKNTKNNKYKINNTKKNKQKYKTNNTKKYKIKKSKTIKHNYYKIKTKKINNYNRKKIIKGGSICNLLKVENNSIIGLTNIPDDVKQNLLETQKKVETLTLKSNSKTIDYDTNNNLSNLIQILITTNNFEINSDDTVEPGIKIDLYELNKKYGAIQIQTSGNLNDCLIHSILTCVSEDFRKLKHKIDKDIIASAFRRKILPYIDGMTELNKQLLQSSLFLDDRIIESINEFYSIQIIAINENYNTDLNFINLYLVDKYSNYIFLIHNSNNIHFTAIKFKNSYNVSMDIFNYLQNKKNEILNTNKNITINELNKKVLDEVLKSLGLTKVNDTKYTNKYNTEYTIEEAQQYLLENGYSLNYP